MALITKPLKNCKTGNIGVVKKTECIIHTNQIRDKDLERLIVVGGGDGGIPATVISKVNRYGGLLNATSKRNSILTEPKKV